MHSIEAQKQALRSEIKRILKSVPTSTVCHWSASIRLQIEAHPRFQQARGVLLFSPLPDEPDILPLVEKALTVSVDGISVTSSRKEDAASDTAEHHSCFAKQLYYLPKVTGSISMEACPVTSLATLKEGAFHIPEPTTLPLDSCDCIDLVIVPGMAFDVEGYRMGRGRGYYDRFLARPDMAQAYRIGICFPPQFLSSLPHSEWDCRMDEIITPIGSTGLPVLKATQHQ